MNAEVSLGTISNVSESIEWLGYTYLFGKYTSGVISDSLLRPCSIYSEDETQSILIW